jgi:phosphoglycolate phosphatase-like HAD superfamily hydrolase
MQAIVFDIDHTIFTTDKVLHEGVVELLVILKQLGVKIGAISDQDHRALVYLDEAGIRQYFDSVLCSAHVEVPKAVDAMHRLLGDLKTAAHDAALVSHAHADILLGREAGMGKTIGVSHGLSNAARLYDANPDHIIPDIPSILDVIQ